jgi:RNA polymerase sigma factor (sigma-70 family)
MKGTADQDLFGLIKESNYPAFTELYERHWKYIYSIAYQKTVNRDDAFDLTQNVFMEFYDKREKLVVNIPIRNYLRTSVLFKLSNYFRSKGFQEKHYRNFQQFVAQAQEIDISIDPSPISETEMEFEVLLDLIYQAIEDMPDKMKQIFLMSRTEQFSINEIAGRLGVAPQTVKNQISNAFSRIRLTVDQKNLSTFHLLFIMWLTQS